MKQQPWTEEQEAELQKLFMQNQESPQTDQDVIDWLCENLSGVSRSRRGVIKKLKELGLIFKAPTKRSNAAALNKNLFMEEEDEKLREIYEEHRLESDCLKRIMEAFDKKRSKKAIVKRMLQLGLIADETEILPSKRNKKMKEKSREHDDDDGETSSSSEDDVRSFSEKQQRVSKNLQAKHQLKQKEATKLLNELEESQRDGIQWIIECLNEAAEDFEEVSDELDDAIPIVPLLQPHREALKNEEFTRLLSSLNLIEPKGQETYWKIPANMIPDELKLRVKILSGENVDDDVEEEKEQKINTVSDEDDDDDLFARLRAQRDVLIYNTSDNEEKLHKIPSKKLTKKIGKPNTKLIKTMKKIVDKEALKWLISTFNDKMRNKMTDNVDDELLLVPSEQSHQDALKDENFVKLLTSLHLQIPEGVENYWSVPKSMTSQQLKIRTELLTPSDDENSDEEERGESSSDEEMVITRKKKRNHDVVESENLEISTQALKQRLAELSASSDDDDDVREHENRSKLIANKRKIMDSSDEEEHNASDQQQRRKSSKRERSITPDENGENEMNASNNSSSLKATKRIRKIVDSSDDE